MRENIPKCEECVCFKTEFSSSQKHGIPLWEILKCTKYNNHPFMARSHEGLCGDNGKNYQKKTSMDFFCEFLALAKD